MIHDKIWRSQVLRSDAVLLKIVIEVICMCPDSLESRSNRSCLMQAITLRDRRWESSFVSSITLGNLQFIAHCSVRMKCNVTFCELNHRLVKQTNRYAKNIWTSGLGLRTSKYIKKNGGISRHQTRDKTDLIPNSLFYSCTEIYTATLQVILVLSLVYSEHSKAK